MKDAFDGLIGKLHVAKEKKITVCENQSVQLLSHV